ncbi:MAG TPA: FecR domain-containing protein [Nodosilinea sp.]|nr:FecR domain-containing protein [Nodosilinea sp.]
MVFRPDRVLVAVLALVSGAAIAPPARAEVPLHWAQLRASTNQVTLVSVAGETRPATRAECLCAGEMLSTSAMARAELLFSDGSLARVGEQANLQFWPTTRKLRLTQGTTAVFVPPGLGRTTLQTPNATVGLNSTAVVVRYVPSRGLTLVMALANSDTGPVSVTLGATGQEIVLSAGQMALISGAGLQVVEFDLLEFYQTSELLAGLQLGNPNYRPAVDEPLAALRPDLMQALTEQPPFATEDAILDPVLINDVTSAPGPTPADDQPLPGADPVGDLRPDSDTPPGVVTPLPAEANPPVEPLPSPPAGEG